MTAGLQPYPEYKDSGLPWLGRVPAHWEIRRAKYLFRCVDIRSTSGKEELLTVSSQRGVVPRSSIKVTMFKAESYVGHKLCWPGNLVINSLWAWARGLGVSKHHGLISSAYGVYRLRDGFEQYVDFIHQLVRSAAFHWELRVRSKGIWISRLQLTDDAFLDSPIPLPTIIEADTIVRFLDIIDRRVTRFIRNRRRLIEGLNEQKQAIINRAVTRGLDPRVPRKPSGIDWLGDIPEHWRAIRLKYVSRVQTGITLGKNYMGQQVEERPYLRVANVQTGRLDLRMVKTVAVPPSEIVGSELKPGDVLMTEGGDIDKLGRGCVWQGEIEGCLHQNHIFAVRADQFRLLPHYLVALMASRLGRVYFQVTAKRTTNLASTNSSTLGAFPLVLPEIKEQKPFLSG